MFSLKLYKFGILLFHMILYTKAEKGLKKSLIQLDTLLMFSGWKNLNDLIFINYYSSYHYPQTLIEIPTHLNKCNQKVRALTIYLGCTYAKVMNNLFSVISNIIQNCENIIKEEKRLINGYICTEEFISIISIVVVPMTTLMKGAMDALDLLHKRPWVTIDKPPYIFSALFERIENIINQLNKLTLTRYNISSYLEALKYIYSFSEKVIFDINNESSSYCNFVTYDINYLWNKWVQEHKVIIGQGVKLVFLEFLSRKIKGYVSTVIKEKYFKLGFKFDPITEETFIPAPHELIELELEFKVTDAT
ncbi:uncharacterized protein LOC126908096 isoform X1 [Daktulosphaira vitifoliae]|uniref:uncharacterized protein LOC126908096 isoform X1 n=1 Tax=Daktulosphaira vitifoliae TaxID=58002 RepID=UPI0021AA9623|nr:uncharacterized protein LOC126908096 isoform X1 [Daktulosphaira vitifoliae]